MSDEDEELDVDLGEPLGWSIRVGARTVKLYFKSLGAADEARLDAAYFKEFGARCSLSALMDEQAVGAHTVAALWWLGRVHEGERRLTLKEAFAEFPRLSEIGEQVDLEMLYEDAPDGSPEV